MTLTTYADDIFPKFEIMKIVEAAPSCFKTSK